MKSQGQQKSWRRALCYAAAVTTLVAGDGRAAEIDTGTPDLELRWDNTVRYNIGMRVDSRNAELGNSPLYDEGTFSFDRGDIVTNRVDLLSELDLVYQGRFGARVSAAFWYDNAYEEGPKTNPNAPFTSIPSYRGGSYSNYTERYYLGPSGEILDAFAFANFDVDDIPVRVKVGRHTVFWGESLYLGGALHSVSYGQAPIDLQKGFATPGAEIKELFRPLNQVSFQAQVTDDLSLAAQVFLEWEAYRYPEGGTYLGPVDFAFNGPDRQYISAALGFATHASPVEPNQIGEFGLAARWSPDILDGTLGFYYRRFADKLPQALLTRVAPASGSEYALIYPDDIDLFGISFTTNIGGVSLGTEFSYRHNTPLNAQILGISPIGRPADGSTPGPRGDTQHALINLLGVLPGNAVFDAATWGTEFTWAHYSDVTSGENLFNAVGYAPCVGKNKWDGCATRNFVGWSASFNPVWFQVVPGIDLSAPMAVSLGLRGNSPTVFGGNEGNGNYTVGLSADVQQKYRVDLKWVDYFGHTETTGNAVSSLNGFTTALKDRGFVSLTLKTTF
ncbi:DUF1302 domain-containing protein [Zavarzinia compransoris]|uniref:DUF1302 domain-containing protein n=1 Tax=Zavarzinia compransoris TaxID=1264899 RepID=A0A317DZK7_9PROT|nr:DUF1302 domain-containing protein [Zavarzinia compransoris]PWR18325.1 DUF1302 domain-containing protein [Zavarzinia compransoris]TDP43616.1 uncharacterized protein DUF1302 [Zavarzinia compransoris]